MNNSKISIITVDENLMLMNLIVLTKSEEVFFVLMNNQRPYYYFSILPNISKFARFPGRQTNGYLHVQKRRKKTCAQEIF